MNRRQKIIVSVVGIFIVLLALVGITYGYFLTRIQGNTNTTSITVTTADLKLVYGDGNGNVTPVGVIMPDNQNFITFSNNTDTKTFTVTNDGNSTVENYVVVVEDVNVQYASNATLEDGTSVTQGQTTTFNRPQDFVYVLSCKAYSGYGTGEQTELSDGCNGIDNETVLPMLQDSILVTNTIEEDITHAYELKIKYLNPDIDQSKDMNKIFSMKVNIYNFSNYNPYSDNTDSLAYNIINNSISKLNGTQFVNTPLTTPAVEISHTRYKTTGEVYTEPTNMYDVNEFNTDIWYYYDSYEVDTNTGKFTLFGQHSCTYSSCYRNLIGKYLYTSYPTGNTEYSSIHENENITNLDNVYKVTETTTSSLKFVEIYNSPDEAERVLVPTIDDYGTSYYYRGDVEDNYVNFAGMCWRIVRIAGDGSIKLILEDTYAECNDNDKETTSAVYTGRWYLGGIDDLADYGSESKNVDSDSSNEDIMNYLEPITGYDSPLVKEFYDFQTTKLADYTSKLKSGDWCLGDRAYKQSGTLGSYTYTPLDKYDYSENMYYDAYTRLTSGNTNGYQPTLKCNGTVLDKFATVSGVSNEAPMYVSTITANEIVFAGGKYGEENNNYYLLNNYSKIHSEYFWSLSPYVFDGKGDRAILMNSHGELYDDYVRSSKDLGRIRPSVSLAPNAVIIGGEGTQISPYVIG